MGRPMDWIVVGVVGDVRDSDYAEQPGPEFYVPLAQTRVGGVTYVARTTGDSRSLADAIQQKIWELTPSQAIVTAGTMDDSVGETLATRNFALAVMAGFGGVALIVASAGLFGLLTYIATRRRTEVGVRLALGATPRRVESLFVRRGLRLIGTGLVFGILASIAFSRFLESFLYETSSLDPVAIVSVLLLMSAVGLLACWIPAHRVASLQPGFILREE
jgi:putative ABC transport system permease protein